MRQTKTILLTVILTVAFLLGATAILAAVYTVSEDTKDSDETVKVIEKVYTPDPVEITEIIDMGSQIDKMNNDKADIESILLRFNNAKDKYNEGLAGLKSKTSLLQEATASFPTIPTKVIPEPELELELEI